MKTLTLAALTLSLFAGAAMAADNRGEISTDSLYGGARVAASPASMAKPGYAVRGEISNDLLYGGIALNPSPSQPIGPRVVERGEISTDLLYGS